MVMHDISITANRRFCHSEGEFVMERGNTKQEILVASLELFSVQGFEATSISQIADAARGPPALPGVKSESARIDDD